MSEPATRCNQFFSFRRRPMGPRGAPEGIPNGSMGPRGLPMAPISPVGPMGPRDLSLWAATPPELRLEAAGR